MVNRRRYICGRWNIPKAIVSRPGHEVVEEEQVTGHGHVFQPGTQPCLPGDRPVFHLINRGPHCSSSASARGVPITARRFPSRRNTTTHGHVIERQANPPTPWSGLRSVQKIMRTQAARQAKKTAAQTLAGLSASKRAPVTTRTAEHPFMRQYRRGLRPPPILKANDTSDMRSDCCC